MFKSYNELVVDFLNDYEIIINHVALTIVSLTNKLGIAIKNFPARFAVLVSYSIISEIGSVVKNGADLTIYCFKVSKF